MDSKSFSNQKLDSALARKFARRAGDGRFRTPEEAMKALVTRLRSDTRRAGSVEEQMRRALRRRHVRSVKGVRGAANLGHIEPLGLSYSEGFRVCLATDTSVARMRFTLAHELCHTFFYELVPEIKFAPHDTDPVEERLCNIGAAEMLMPFRSVTRDAKSMPVRLDSLAELARKYSVSLAAMFIRLNSIGLWKCELSTWYRLTNGSFALANYYGGTSRPWEWDDKSILRSAWLTNRLSYGQAYVKFKDDRGTNRFKSTPYEAGRFGQQVLALWGIDIDTPTREYPLLRS